MRWISSDIFEIIKILICMQSSHYRMFQDCELVHTHQALSSTR